MKKSQPLNLFIALISIFSSNLASAQDIDILSGVKIKLRDGVHLNATIYN